MGKRLYIWVMAAGFVVAGQAVAAGSEEGNAWTVKLAADVEMEFMPIPAGSFQMGSNEFDDEKPVHTVQISQPFWLAKTEVTVAQWKCFLDETGHTAGTDWKDRDCPLRESDGLFSLKNNKFGGDWDKPMCEIDWATMVEFCKWLTERERAADRLPESLEYTLPTEAQWEYACRAPSACSGQAGATNDFAGSLDDLGWYDANAAGKTHPVGMKQPNAWGLYDMHGNVWEFCLDWYTGMGAYPNKAVTDPRGPSAGVKRVSRGGSWRNSAVGCRSAFRTGWAPEYTGSYIGFRPAISAVALQAMADRTQEGKED